MGNIKIRNLTAANSTDIISGDMVPIALDDDAGLARVTRRATFSQIVSGGSGVLAADPNSPFVFNNTDSKQIFRGGISVGGDMSLSGNLNLTGTISGDATGYFNELYITGAGGGWHQITTGWSGSAGGGSSLWTANASDIYYNDGDVGVGTTTPSARLHVTGGDGRVLAPSGHFSKSLTISGSVGIGTSTPAAPLEVSSTAGGVIMPRMTTAQMNAISTPSNGEMIYNTDSGKFAGYEAGGWQPLVSASSGPGYVEGYAATIGGTLVDDGNLLTVTHNLGTENVIVQVYIADDAAGTNNLMLNNQSDGSSGFLYDYQVQTATTNSIKVQLSASGWTKNDGTATAIHTNYTGKFIKVVVLTTQASAGATSASYDSGWSASTVTSADTVTITHGLGRTDLTAQIWLSRSTETTKGDNPFQADLTWDGAGNPYGATITNLTTTQVTLQVGSLGINYLLSNGADANAGTCFYRIILN